MNRSTPSQPASPSCGAMPFLPRRPQASPLCRLLADHFETLPRIYEERYEPTHGQLGPVVAEVVGKFLDCGLLEHRFARVRCAACRAEFLVAFRCKGRGFCPSCQARRLAEWSLGLDEHLLAPVAHRHVVLTIPKRLRAYFIHDRRRLGLLSRVAYRTLHGYGCAAVGESDAVPGVVSLAQSFGSLAHGHPHLHVVVTDGAFRRDGGFVTWTAQDAAVLAELWRRAVLALFVREGWFEEPAAASMLAWPDSGFSAYVSVHRFAALEFVARLVQHIPSKGEVRVRYYGAYASRRRGWWRRRGVVLAGAGQEQAHDDAEREVEPWPALRARWRRWAELLRLVFAVEVEVCTRCGGEMRIIAFVREHAVAARILAHLARGGIDARAGPWAAAAG